MRAKPPAGHGTSYRYKRGRCRCVPCTEAHRRATHDAKARRVARGRANPGLIPHGTLGGYRNWECRCADCTGANTADTVRYRETHPRRPRAS